MIADPLPHDSPAHRHRRPQFSLRTLLILATVSCFVLTAEYAQHQRMLARRAELTKRLDSLFAETKEKMDIFLHLSDGPQRPSFGEPRQEDPELAALRTDTERLQQSLKDVSAQIQSIDDSRPTLFERAKSWMTASND